MLYFLFLFSWLNFASYPFLNTYMLTRVKGNNNNKKSPKHPYKQSCSRVISLVSDRVLEALNKVLVAIHCLKSQKKKLQSSEMTG